MKCARCGVDLSPDDCHDHWGQSLCEDCYIGALQPPRPCDPAAVTAAQQTRSQFGQKGTQGLTQLQKDLYEFIKSRGKVTAEECIATFKVPKWELDKQFAILRHCELVRGMKEGDTVYLTLME